MGHISSGKRINRAADDAAGLAVAENLDASIRSQVQARRNIQDGLSLISVVEGAYKEIGNHFKRMRELAVQSSTETYTDADRAFMSDEFEQIREELGRLRQSTEFNGQPLMAYAGGFDFAPKVFSVQVGADNTENDRIDITIDQPFNIFTYGWQFPAEIGRPFAGDPYKFLNLGVETKEKAQETMLLVDEMQLWHNHSTTKFAATHNRLNHALNNLEVSNENKAAAQSRIQDADMAFQAAELSKGQIMSQASTAVLGQANGLNQTVLRLI